MDYWRKGQLQKWLWCGLNAWYKHLLVILHNNNKKSILSIKKILSCRKYYQNYYKTNNRFLNVEI